MDYETANFIVLIINTFMCLSSPLNLAVYCGMSNQFREQFTKIMTSSCGAPDTGLGPLVSVQLSLTQVQPTPAFTSPASAGPLYPTSMVDLRCETRAVAPECPYLAGNKRLCRRETSV